jgi:predicted Fe-S protein YdhL (DUF1289 family)
MTSLIESPCVKVCAVEPVSGLCMGCNRTLPEIAQWGRLSPEQRRAIMDDLPHRRTARAS